MESMMTERCLETVVKLVCMCDLLSIGATTTAAYLK